MDPFEKRSIGRTTLMAPRLGFGAGTLGDPFDVVAEHQADLTVEAAYAAELAEVAASINAALDRELPFKCTAGLHHAVRHEGGHGFLNVLLATRANLDGDDVVAVLDERDPAALVARLDPETMLRTRRWFTSFGSCSVLEPHEDLVELGVIA